jgi:hypothetical protein
MQVAEVKSLRRAIKVIAKQNPKELQLNPHLYARSPQFFKKIFEIERRMNLGGLSHNQKVLLHRALEKAVAKAKGLRN